MYQSFRMILCAISLVRGCLLCVLSSTGSFTLSPTRRKGFRFFRGLLYQTPAPKINSLTKQPLLVFFSSNLHPLAIIDLRLLNYPNAKIISNLIDGSQLLI